MPLSIIRNDITRVKADAIVNTANPDVAVGDGTDYAVYKAAGLDKLLDERAKIGTMKPGQAAVTPAFALDAKYIIHTVGPAWRGGSYGERETVAECYRNCLEKAAYLECGSVAFPLISTGTYGFPKDEALDIAIREISGFLDDHEMDVTLVVYDRESFALSSELFEDIRSYISDAEAVRSMPFETSYSMRAPGAPAGDDEEVILLNSAPVGRGAAGRRRRRVFGSSRRMLKNEAEESAVLYDGMAEESEKSISRSTGALYSEDELSDAFDGAAGNKTLEELIRSKDESFQQKLLHLIDASGMTDPEVYKKANIDRKLFSKIRSNEQYKPTKKTAVAFAFALGLNLDQTADLLRSAGMSLSQSSTFDIIIQYCLERGITNIHEVNCILFEFDQMLLGA